ncbi:MAG: DUF2809 domain-containing protein [Nodosilinea sp.]
MTLKLFSGSLGAYRRVLLWSFGAITLLGTLGKFYPGPGRSWLNNSFGGVPYVILFMALVALIWPRLAQGWVALGVLVATCLLEVLQLWQPAWLQAVRATLPGRLVLGSTFSLSDFWYYLIGAGLGWLGLRWL